MLIQEVFTEAREMETVSELSWAIKTNSITVYSVTLVKGLHSSDV